MITRRFCLATLLIVGPTLGCAANLGNSHLDSHDSYFVRSPQTKHFSYERKLDGDSWVRGELSVEIDEVQWPTSESETYRFSGRLTSTRRGHFATRLAAREAPMAAVQAAMDPANVIEVFEVQEPQPGVQITHLHWDRLGTLDLPIDVTNDQSASKFSSELRHGSWDSAIELVMVWHKVLIPIYGVPPFGTFSMNSIEERQDDVTLVIEQDLGQGKSISYEYSFAGGGRSLTGVVVHLLDGTQLTMVEVGGRSG